MIGFLITIMLSVGLVHCGINWNGKNWAHNCDFRGNDLSNAHIPGDQCGGKCAATAGCTHFTWTNYRGGTCWMKKGAVSKSNAFESHGEYKVCGVNSDSMHPVASPHGSDKQNVCSDWAYCLSKWGFCGTGEAYCGDGCQSGPCWNTNRETNGVHTDDIINEQNFACIFDTIDAGTRSSRLNGLKNSGWKPANRDEAAVFLAHVYHETDGLKTIQEYCAPGCGSHYAGSWCSIQGKPGKLYYGRGWFQLSWPCNYHRAGQALGVDILSNPDLIEQDQSLAVRTAIWFYEANGMAGPARTGDFATTTRIINGNLECNGGSGSRRQMIRVSTYRRVRQCFSLGEPSKNPVC